MSLRDDLRRKLTPEQYTAVIDALGDDFPYDVVPRSRLNKVINQRDNYKEQLELALTGTQQLDDDDENEPDDDESQTTSKKQTSKKSKSTSNGKPKQLDETAIRQQYENERDEAILKVRIQYAGLDKLRNEGAVDPEVAYGLLDLTNVKFGADGKLEGFDEQVTSLKEKKGYLFGATQQQQGASGSGSGNTGRQQTPGGTGKNSAPQQFDGVNTVADFVKLSTSDQLKFKEAYPEKFKSFLGK